MAYLVHVWALAYPMITGTTALLALCYMTHTIAKLVWRWWHGYPNFLTDREAAALKEKK